MSSDPIVILTNMTRQLLDGQAAQGIDRPLIDATLVQLAPVVSMRTRHVFRPEEITAIARDIETLFIIEQGPALSLRAERRPPDWYVGERRRPGRFMDRYLQKLREDSWPERSIEELQNSTARVLELIDDPEREGPWDWRGLVVGDVQSGKTAHYAGVINRAADAGYRVIVVLAGMHNLLRLQTQLRLEADFLGRDSDPRSFNERGERRLVGVGRINPHLIVDSLTSASPSGDFNLRVAQGANFTPSALPFLFVVKKNGRILQNLNTWISRLQAPGRAAPLLVIDDEADQASVDTGDQELLPDGTFDEEYEPKRINGEIRRLLNSFGRSAYVAYTATPFANILMHDERRAQDFGADLFPSTFIMALTPPDDYFGPAAVFGTNDDDTPALPVIRHVDQTAENWITDTHDIRHRPAWRGQNRIPPSLENAIDAFLLACAARTARGRPTAHNSMLVHVSRFVAVHGIVRAQVQQHLDAVRAMISGRDPATLDRLRTLWETDFVPTTARMALPCVFGRNTVPVTWLDVLAQLSASSDRIRVVETNGSTKAGLDYDAYKDTGLSVIAIGGDKLSRGLTLEGLTVSYFLRISRQYDSLLQMGRWFGYRRGFADLCRLYTTPDMEDWFRHVATANKELRSRLLHMQAIFSTPKEYGLRVASHSIMSVTAANKQRHAVERSVSFSGEGKVQTVLFRDRQTVELNAEATDRFIESLGAGLSSPPRPAGSGVANGSELWRDIPGRAVAGYLRSLSFPPENFEIEGGRLAAFIEARLAHGELVSWTVLLAAGGRGEAIRIANRDLTSVTRRAIENRLTDTRYIVKTILHPPDQAIDLSDSGYQRALDATNTDRVAENKEPGDVPSPSRIRAERSPSSGLLIIYPLDPVAAEAGTRRPLIGIVVSFPESADTTQTAYVENTVSQREQA